MPRYKLIIAYEGTNFCGWQKQEPPDGRAPEQAEDVAASGSKADQAPAASPATAAFAEWTPRIDSTRPGRVALRTVQGVVEQAVRAVVREPVELFGASRTDSGVHARGQVAAFSCEPRNESLGEEPTTVAAEVCNPAATTSSSSPSMPTAPPAPPTPNSPKGVGWPLARGCDRLVAAVNSRLPDDVLVLAAEPVSTGFDPVAATSKGYSYTFHCSAARPLRDRNFVHHVWHPRGLNVAAMNAAAAVLVGEHDFSAFAAAGHGRLSTVRTIFDCRVLELPAPDESVWLGSSGGTSGGPGASVAEPHGTLPDRAPARRVRIEVSGSGFLWNMVRIIAGTLMQVGMGHRPPESVREALLSRDRTRAGPTAPPTGLCLEWIRYDR